MNHTTRRGVTLIELLVAMLLLSIGVLGLAASSASLSREIVWNADRYRASSLARARIETLAASRCQSARGSDRAGSVITDWVATVSGVNLAIDQTVTRVDSRGSHVDAVHGGSWCN
jgi:prepilin-type N-terminal cleavage/methylation domain